MIAPVTKENEQVWAELNIELWPECSVEGQLEELASGFLKNQFLYYINDIAIAFLSLSVRRDYVSGADNKEDYPVGYLEGIYIKPEYRKCGIGRKLVEFSKQWARENGCKTFASDCLIGNSDSEKWHKKIGFTEAERTISFAMKLG